MYATRSKKQTPKRFHGFSYPPDQTPVTRNKKKHQRGKAKKATAEKACDATTATPVMLAPDTQDTAPLSPSLFALTQNSHVSDSPSSRPNMNTLLTDSWLCNLPLTPTQDKHARVLQDLVLANSKIIQLNRDLQRVNDDLRSETMRVQLKERECLALKEANEQLQIKLNDLSTLSDKQVQVEEMLKTLTLLSVENTDLRKKVTTLEQQATTVQYTVPTNNPFEVLGTIEDEQTKMSVRTETTCTDEKLLFRGWWDPLSAFFAHPLIFRGKSFPSAEHCYQYHKAMHHKNTSAAQEILNAKQPGLAKKIANRYLPQCDKNWEETNTALMEDISTAKYEQCAVFRQQLQASGNKILIHNMETDGKWGCGKDGNGENRMGHILMRVRKNAPSAPQRPASAPLRTPSPNTNVLVLGNSNARNISNQLVRTGVNSTGFVFPGRPSRLLQERLPHCKPPTHVVICTGDIDARTNRPFDETSDVIMEAQQLFASSHIMVCGLSTKVRDGHLHRQLRSFNGRLHKLCVESEGLEYIESSDLPLRDDIHHTAAGKRRLVNLIRTCVLGQCL